MENNDIQTAPPLQAVPKEEKQKPQVISHFEVPAQIMELIFSTIGKRPWLEINDVMNKITSNIKVFYQE